MAAWSPTWGGGRLSTQAGGRTSSGRLSSGIVLTWGRTWNMALKSSCRFVLLNHKLHEDGVSSASFSTVFPAPGMSLLCNKYLLNGKESQRAGVWANDLPGGYNPQKNEFKLPTQDRILPILPSLLRRWMWTSHWRRKTSTWTETLDIVSSKDGKGKHKHHLGRRRGSCTLWNLKSGPALFLFENEWKENGSHAFLFPSVSTGGSPSTGITLPPPPAHSMSNMGISPGCPYCTVGTWRCWVFWCRLRMDLWLKLLPQAGQW